MGAAPDLAVRNKSSSCSSPGRGHGSRGAELVLANLLTTLVVDEVTVCRLRAFHWLESVSIQTVMVGSGQEALELTGMHYDFILVARYMRDMNGPETIRLMRERGVRSKIIGLTSGKGEKAGLEMIQAGADDCLEELLSANALANILADIGRR